MFDPENVALFKGAVHEGCFRVDGQVGPDGNSHHDGPFVLKSGYDQLLVLYREAKAGRESFAKGMMTMRQNSHDPQTP